MGSDSDRRPSARPSLPRVAYLGDAPIEAGMGGSALIYRLFFEYPTDRLWVVQGRKGDARRRLPGVRYLAGTPIRFIPARWPRLHALMSLLRARLVAPALAKRIKSFDVDAVVTVAYES